MLEIINKLQSLINKFKKKDKWKYEYYYINQKAIFLKNNNYNFKKIKNLYLKNLTNALNNGDLKLCTIAYNNIGNLYIEKKNDSAILFLNRAYKFQKNTKTLYNYANFYYLTKNFEKSLFFIDKIKQDKKFITLKSLSLKISNFIGLYYKNKDSKYLNYALETIEKIEKQMKFLKNEELSNRSILFWQKELSEVYFNGVLCSKLINNLDLAFYYFEKNKAKVLLNKISKNTNNVQNIIEKNILQKAKKTIKDEVIISYISSKYNSEIVFEMILSKESTQIITLDKKKLKKDLANCKQIISKPILTKTINEKFQNISTKIYNELFPNSNIQKIISKKKLLISTDDPLQNFPFEILNYKYKPLIFDNEISYIFSFSWYLHNKKLIRNPTKEFLAFAPLSFNQNNLYNLLDAKDEINNISKMFHSKCFIDNLATKNNFINNAYNYNIIHLTTHSLDNNYNPWIAFKNKMLYLDEVYSIKNQAELVVLSACNTSLGEKYKGEGILSLARGFIYSGSKSVVSSLWSINDKATTTIMTDFYKNLKNGQTKSKSLQQAKIHYLKTHSLSEASPYYWASFVLIGDGDKIDFKTDYAMYYWLFGFLVLGCLVWMYLSLRRRNG